MRILFVSNSFYPCLSSGGVVRSAFELSRCLIKKGHEVVIATTDGCSTRLKVERNKELDIEGLHIIYFANVSNKLRMKTKIATPIDMPIFMKNNCNKFDIVHIHEHRTIPSLLAAYYSLKNSVPYIIQSHGSFRDDLQRTTYKKIFDKIFGRSLLVKSNKIVTLNIDEASQFINAGISMSNISIIGNGIKSRNKEDTPEYGDFRRKYNIESGVFLILYLSRITKLKSADKLIIAFKDVINRIPNSKLVIAGPDDGWQIKLEEIARKNSLFNDIIFTGPIYDEKEKNAAYLDCDVYVLPSTFEAFPMTILEAWSLARPVIVTEGCGIADIVRQSNAGLVVDKECIELSNSLIDLWENRQMRINMGENGYKIFLNNYEISKIADKFIELYADCISHN